MHDEKLAPKKDAQTVDSAWQSIKPRIHGVEIKFLPTIPDDRGTLCEVFRPAWGLHPDPLIYVYQVTIRPGQIKGWVKHVKQDDRIFVSMGLEAAHLTEERLLIRSVFAVGVMAHTALLGTIRALDRGRHHPSFLTIPNDLLRNMSKIGRPYIGILCSCLEAHRSDR